MKVRFYKYHGAGNDFIMVDDRKDAFSMNEAEIALFCHRRFGVGADGLILLQTSGKADFRMKYYNSDGREGSMCGNGGRCSVAFAAALGLGRDVFRFEASDGLHEASVSSFDGQNAEVVLRMADVARIDAKHGGYFLDTGSPHHVEFVEDCSVVDVVKRGREIRYSAAYKPGGVNVNFVQPTDQGLFVRTYERGVEDETLACGTGATAVALVWALLNPEIHSAAVNSRGGQLKVSFERSGEGFAGIWLEGPAVRVFEGEYETNAQNQTA